MQAQTANAPKQSTELDFIYQAISDQNNRLVNNIAALENLGHKMKDTNYPKGESEVKDKAKPDGILAEINVQIDYLRELNTRIEQFVEKLSKLI